MQKPAAPRCLANSNALRAPAWVGVATADDRERWHVQQPGVAFYVEALRRSRNLFEKLGEVFIASRDDVVAARLQPFVIHTYSLKKTALESAVFNSS